MAPANVIAAWPDGNDRLSLPSGRLRCVANLIGSTSISVIACARSKSMPKCETFGWSKMRPYAYVPSDSATCSGVLP